MRTRKLQPNFAGVASLAMLASVVVAEPAVAVSVSATPFIQGERITGLTNSGTPFDTVTVFPVGVSDPDEFFGAGLLSRSSSNEYGLEFSLSPLLALEPLRGYTIVSALLTVNYAGGIRSAGGVFSMPSMDLEGFRDADGMLTLDDFTRSALYSDQRVGLPIAVPAGDFVSPQVFDVTSFVQTLYNQQAPFAGFRFDSNGSITINGFNSDTTLRPTLIIQAAVPEPAAVLFVGCGLAWMLGFASLRRRRGCALIA